MKMVVQETIEKRLEAAAFDIFGCGSSERLNPRPFSENFFRKTGSPSFHFNGVNILYATNQVWEHRGRRIQSMV